MFLYSRSHEIDAVFEDVESIVNQAMSRCREIKPITTHLFCSTIGLLLYTAAKYKECHLKRADGKIQKMFESLQKLVRAVTVKISTFFGNPNQEPGSFKRDFATKELNVSILL